MTGDDHVLARDLAGQAGQRLLELRAQGGDPDVLRKAGDRLSHEFLTAELAGRRPGDVVLSEEGADNPARLGARRVWIVDPLDGTREFGEPGRTDWAVHVALWESGVNDLTAGAVQDAEARASERPLADVERAALIQPAARDALAFLAPAIVTAILNGRNPPQLTANRLMDDTRLPLDWTAQRELLCS